jgi:phosphohistidine phosphatase
MAAYLINKGVNPQQLVSSTATRAITTARIFAENLKYPEKSIKGEAKIYNSNNAELMEVIRKLDDAYDSIMLFGHDTSITVVTEELSNQRFLHFPTCGVAGITLRVDSWADVFEGCGELQFFYFPKGIDDELKALKKAAKTK